MRLGSFFLLFLFRLLKGRAVGQEEVLIGFPVVPISLYQYTLICSSIIILSMNMNNVTSNLLLLYGFWIDV